MTESIVYHASRSSYKKQNRKIKRRRRMLGRMLVLLACLAFVFGIYSMARITVNAVEEIIFEYNVLRQSSLFHSENEKKHGFFTGNKNDKSTQIILDVPFLGQGDYPTGCESVTAVMALNYKGCPVTADDFIDNCLTKGSYRAEGSNAYGDDPNQVFIGDPRSTSGYGCYAPALKKAMKTAAPDLKIKDLCGTPFSELTRWIDDGTPVVVWATMEMAEPYAGSRWLLPDGSMFTWVAKEHCLLLVGYDDNCYWFNDPYQDKGLTAYDRKTVELRYEQLGMQALAVES